MKKFESMYFKIFVKGKRMPLNVAMSKDEAGSNRGIEAFWSETNQHPDQESSDGAFILHEDRIKMFTIEKIYRHNYIYLGIYASSDFIKVNIGISFINSACMRELIEHEKPMDQRLEVKEFVIIRPKERKMFSGIQKDIKVKIDGYAGNKRMHDEYQAGVKVIRK